MDSDGEEALTDSSSAEDMNSTMNENYESEASENSDGGPLAMTPGEIRIVNELRVLEGEELEEEETSTSSDEGDDVDEDRRVGDGGAGRLGGFTFDPFTSLHSYLGELDDVPSGQGYTHTETSMKLPMFFLEGVVLFPDMSLPLRVRQPRFISAVIQAVRSENAKNMIGVVHIGVRNPAGRAPRSIIGTVAEIRHCGTTANGSLAIVARGVQCLRLKRAWEEGDAIMADVDILEEDVPSPIPRDAFLSLAAIPSPVSGTHVHHQPDSAAGIESAPEDDSRTSHVSSPSTSTAGSSFPAPDWLQESRRVPRAMGAWGGAVHGWETDARIFRRRAAMAYWPHWVYRMFDPFDLARRVADMFRQVVDVPLSASLTASPARLAWYVARNIPVQDSFRQELLELPSVISRLRRIIQILEGIDRLQCRACSAVIGHQCDVLAMSSEGAISAFVNPYGHVHETVTLRKVSGLLLEGVQQKKDCWFPGYAWTIAHCASCGTHMGWLYTAVKKRILPRSFWGVRRCQIMCQIE